MPIFSRSQPEVRRVAQQLTLENENGLHARPATAFVRCASAFQSRITIRWKGKSYRADRIMEILLADLNCGDTFMIEALGPDSIQAVQKIAQLVASLKEAEERARMSKNPNGEIVD